MVKAHWLAFRGGCRAAALLAAAILCGCASTAPGGRSQVTAPTSVSSLYSSLDMNMRLAAATSIADECRGVQCQLNAGLDLQVARLGARLAEAAYAADPTLRERVPQFTFTVAEKSEPGSTSNASGTIVIFRGVRNSAMDERTLAFLLAREMGHVIARHHEERSATSFMLSAIVQVVMPVANVAPAMASLLGSAASMFGTDAVDSDQDVQRNREAEGIAFRLMADRGWPTPEVKESLVAYTTRLSDGPWSRGLRGTLARLDEPVRVAAPAAPIPVYYGDSPRRGGVKVWEEDVEVTVAATLQEAPPGAGGESSPAVVH